MDIVDLQEALRETGFDPGFPDGIMGPKTEAAILNFQRSKGLPSSGMPDDETTAALAALVAASPASGSGSGWIQFLDVSAYQGVIDFVKVKASDYPLVAIKATEGLTRVDPGFRQRWQDAKAAGLPRFAYHFFHPNQDGAAQAAFFLRTLAGDLGEIVPALDWETDGGASAAQQIASADAWYAAVDPVYQSYHSKPFAYSYSSFFSALRLPARFATRPLWLAGYVRDDRLVIPSPWKKYDIWQYAGDATSPPVEGIDPRIKKDYNKYRGSLDEFMASYGKS